MNRDQILEILDDFSIPTFQRDLPGGGTIVAMQRGARVLALFPRKEGTSENVLWVNPNIEAILNGTEKDWEGEGEGSVGGDRLWMSPEQAFYYRQPQTFGEWVTPKEMDPGNYHDIKTDENSVTYENRFDLKNNLTGGFYKNVMIRRTLTLLDSPLADFQPRGKKNIGYVGYTTEETMEIGEVEGPDPVVCPWGLAQIIPPKGGVAGTVIIPTAHRAEPIDYFGALPPDRIAVHANYVTCKIDGQWIVKIAIRPEDLAPTGPVRIAYISRVPSAEQGSLLTKQAEWILLIRESEDVARSSADAIDPARSNPDGLRGVIQAYNNGPHPPTDHALFGEIEMQYLPVRKVIDGLWRSTAHSRFMAFQAEKEDILTIASRLLGLESIVLFD